MLRPCFKFDRARMLLGWTHSGFSVHRGRVVAVGDREEDFCN